MYLYIYIIIIIIIYIIILITILVMQELINKINKILENRTLLFFSYWFLLLFQFTIIYRITWRLDSIYFVSLTFSLLLLFILFSTVIISFVFSILLLCLIFYNSWLSLLFYIFTGLLLGLIFIIIYEFVDNKYNKHIKKIDIIYSFSFKIYKILLIVFWISFFLYWFFLYWKDLFWNPKNVIIEREIWKYEEFKLRFYNIDYYFLETWSWTIKIYDSLTIKSLEFKDSRK